MSYARPHIASLLENDRIRSNIHAVLCGEFLEISIFPESNTTGCDRPTQEGEPSNPESPESILARSIARSQKRIRQAVNANGLWILHTLTYAIEHPRYFQGEKPFVLRSLEWQKNRERVIEDWRIFARKMRRYQEKRRKSFRYVCVIETHEGKRAIDTTVKQGCFHIHFVSDEIFPKRLLQAKWGHGLCNFSDWRKGRKSEDMKAENDLPACTNPGAYMSKYLGKQGEDIEGGKKRYWLSTGLRKPRRVSEKELNEIFSGTCALQWKGTSCRHIDGKESPYVTEHYTYRVGREFALPTSDTQTQKEKRLRKNRVKYAHSVLADKLKDYAEEKELYKKAGNNLYSRDGREYQGFKNRHRESRVVDERAKKDLANTKIHLQRINADDCQSRDRPAKKNIGSKRRNRFLKFLHYRATRLRFTARNTVFKTRENGSPPGLQSRVPAKAKER